MNSQLIVGIIILFILFYYAFKKDNFYNIQKDLQEDYDLYYRPTFYSNQVVPAEKNQTITNCLEIFIFFRIVWSKYYLRSNSF
jgi:hypothetical protein